MRSKASSKDDLPAPVRPTTPEISKVAKTSDVHPVSSKLPKRSPASVLKDTPFRTSGRSGLYPWSNTEDIVLNHAEPLYCVTGFQCWCNFKIPQEITTSTKLHEMISSNRRNTSKHRLSGKSQTKYQVFRNSTFWFLPFPIRAPERPEFCSLRHPVKINAFSFRGHCFSAKGLTWRFFTCIRNCRTHILKLQNSSFLV